MVVQMAEKQGMMRVESQVALLVAQMDVVQGEMTVVSRVEQQVNQMAYLMEKMKVEHLDSSKDILMVVSLV